MYRIATPTAPKNFLTVPEKQVLKVPTMKLPRDTPTVANEPIRKRRYIQQQLVRELCGSASWGRIWRLVI